MTTRFFIALAATACALHASRPRAHSQGADNFIPDQPPKTGADTSAGDSHAVKYALLLPSEKSSETVKDGERNPFGSSDDSMRDSGGKSTSEETKIQEQLSRLRATGISPGPNGLRVLFGDMWLAKDDVVPAVIKDQTLALRVNEVSREAIQLMWMEKKFTGLPPRLLVLPVDLRATVRRVPHGQIPEEIEAKPESRASKRATAVELPVSIAANADLAEARKVSRLAPPPPSPDTPDSPATKEPSVIIASTPGKLPFLGGAAAPPETSTATSPQIAGPPAPAAVPDAAQTAAATPPQPPAAVPGPAATPQPQDPGLARSTAATSGASNQPAESTASTGPAQPSVPTTTEPAAWKRAMGLMENLVKLSEANKK